MKILAKELFLAVALVSALSACSDDDNNSPAPTNASATTEEDVADTDPLETLEPDETAPPEQPQSVAKLENRLPGIQPIQTAGGKKLMAYLQGTIPGEDVIKFTFDESDEVMNKYADMSFAVLQLRENDQLDGIQQSRLNDLDVALTEAFNDDLRHYKKVEAGSEIGVAALVGVVGGVFGERAWTAARAARSSGVVPETSSTLGETIRSLGGKSRNIRDWLSGKSAAQQADDAVVGSISRGHKMYANTLAKYGLRGDVSSSELVSRHLTKVLGTDIAKGARLSPVPETELAKVKALKFNKTGQEGFFINRTAPDEITVRQVVANGSSEYHVIKLDGVKSIDRTGAEAKASAAELAALIESKFMRRNWFRDAFVFMDESGTQTVRSSVTQPAGAARAPTIESAIASASKKATNKKTKSGATASRSKTKSSSAANAADEAASGASLAAGVADDAAAGAASTQALRLNFNAERVGRFSTVALPLGTATYFAIRAPDYRYMALNDYVKDLEEMRPLNIEQHNDKRREQKQARAKPKVKAAVDQPKK